MKLYVVLGVTLFSLFGCKNNNSDDQNNSSDNASTASNEPPLINFQVVNKYPHDTSSFTEGLLMNDGDIYESTGNKGKSFVRKNNLKTGDAIKREAVPNSYFGEGISIIGDKIYQLTWQEHKVYVYDKKTFKQIASLDWPMEGWGMTTDGKKLIITTGDSNLYFVDPSTFKVLNTVGVSDNYGPVSNLNEVELVDGFVYANVWHTNWIYKINPETGAVVGKMDLTNINGKNGVNFTPHDEAVLNGIAYNPSTKTFLVTGKNWPYLFELKPL